MNRRVILMGILAVLGAVQCEETGKTGDSTGSNLIPGTVGPTTTATTTTTTTTATTLPGLCTVCTCTGDIVNCNDKNLTNHFADSQWPNNSIREISFAKNSLIHVKPFPKVAIQKLDLQQNKIARIDNCAFKQLINLTELDLSHNQLTSELLEPHVFQGRFSPESYEPLAKLTTLNLSHNVLHSLHQSLFEHLTSLKVLSLAGNPFGSIDLRTSIAISTLWYLEHLDLSSCDLRILPDTQFRTLRHLRILNLTSNRLEFLPTPLEELETLEYLYLDENPIRTLDHGNVFPRLPRLKELSLCCMPHLRNIGRTAFSGLIALEHLRIENCPHLEKIDEGALVLQTDEGAVWPPLKRLDLSDNALKYLPALLVGRWDWLEKLDLANNKWSCDCENQYLVGSLLPQQGERLMGAAEMNALTCSAPPEHEGEYLSKLFHRKLRCLDLYEARPEKDAAILVGVLIGLLLAIPLGLAIFIFWRRGFFFCGDQSPGGFSRAFYKRAANEDDA